MKPLNKAFGTTFRDKFLQISLYSPQQNNVDGHFFYQDQEFENLQDFINKNNLTQDEFKKIQDLIINYVNKN